MPPPEPLPSISSQAAGSSDCSQLPPGNSRMISPLPEPLPSNLPPELMPILSTTMDVQVPGLTEPSHLSHPTHTPHQNPSSQHPPGLMPREIRQQNRALVEVRPWNTKHSVSGARATKRMGSVGWMVSVGGGGGRRLTQVPTSGLPRLTPSSSRPLTWVSSTRSSSAMTTPSGVQTGTWRRWRSGMTPTRTSSCSCAGAGCP